MRVAVTNRMSISPIPKALYPATRGLPSRRSSPTSSPPQPSCRTMADACFVLLDDRGVLAVSGADRRTFLQGLVSNDVDKVGPDQACYAALLTAQGKYLHDFMMVEASATILLDAEAVRLADLERRLLIYRLRAKAIIDQRPDLAVAAIFGNGATAALGLP